jgi:arylsulfatase A-like enzyme/Flp pilus assembly protein TadD
MRAAILALLFPIALSAAQPDVVLITLDTTRADAVGAGTPVLEALARRGTRYTRAISPAPLTLPAHCSLLTGLEPIAHGVHDNGTAALPPDIPTIATELERRGYTTGAFVASRVLDRRFGLARGFDLYDDAIAAEQFGEFGYPERDAAQVTTAALAWASKQPAARPIFLWIHYYDPHAPYEPPAPLVGYAGEVQYVDREIGRLLSGLRGDPAKRVVVAVGDHGESLGEHGEATHGILLYRSTLEVPLIIAGPGVPAGRVVRGAVSTTRVAATIARLAGKPLDAAAGGPVFSETHLPATQYGWSALQSVIDGRHHFILAPRVELYDLDADPGEKHNIAADQRREVFRLRNALLEHDRAVKHRDATTVHDPALAAALRSLGYLSGASRPLRSDIDPKDGIAMLREMEAMRTLLHDARAGEAAAGMDALVRRSPGNVPFLTLLGEARLAAGDFDAAVGAYRQAIALNPSLDFLHFNLAGAYRKAGNVAQAAAEYRLTLKINPRLAQASLRLAELDAANGRAVLRASVAAGSSSATVLTRLAELDLAAGDADAADRDLQEAVRVEPKWAPAWLLMGNRADTAGRTAEARDDWRRAAAFAPDDPRPLLLLGRSYLQSGQRDEAKRYLQRVIDLAPDSDSGKQARLLLGQLAH